MDAHVRELYDPVQRHLLNANEELLGLHRVGLLSYDQYAAIANLLVDAQGMAKRMLSGEKETVREEEQHIPVPFWLFQDEVLSPLAKWTYAYLLKLRREFCQPGRNELVIQLKLVSQDIFPTYAWTEKHLITSLEELTRAKIIAARKMDYPQDYPEHWGIDFLREPIVTA
jgi:hypothetical protein